MKHEWAWERAKEFDQSLDRYTVMVPALEALIIEAYNKGVEAAATDAYECRRIQGPAFPPSMMRDAVLARTKLPNPYLYCFKTTGD